MLLLTGPKTEYREVFMGKTLVRNNINYIKVVELSHKNYFNLPVTGIFVRPFVEGTILVTVEQIAVFRTPEKV